MDPSHLSLKVGDQVRKKDGYPFPGIVVSVFTTTTGKIRYVVECTVPCVAGMLHIYNGSQLELVPKDTDQLELYQ